MEIWETIGLWRYPVPGFFLLAQFCLAILVAMGILVNSSVFLYMSDREGQSMNGNCSVEGKKTLVINSNILHLLHISYYFYQFLWNNEHIHKDSKVVERVHPILGH